METPELKASGLTFRFAQPSDAESFTRWAVENPKIPHKDILASMKANNPTSTVLVIEENGVPILFAPFYCQMNLAYLGFNPEYEGKIRLKALNALQWAIASFAYEFGVREVTVQTSKDYPVGKWALKHGFKEENRQTFTMRVTPISNPDEETADVQ
jgi:hypothetical protein